MMPLPSTRRSPQAKAVLFRHLAKWVSTRAQTEDLALRLHADWTLANIQWTGSRAADGQHGK
jgi:hypothetical protein